MLWFRKLRQPLPEGNAEEPVSPTPAVPRKVRYVSVLLPAALCLGSFFFLLPTASRGSGAIIDTDPWLLSASSESFCDFSSVLAGS